MLCGLPEAAKAGRYFSLRLSLNVGDAKAEKKQSKLDQELRQLTDKVLFFPLALGKIPLNKQKFYLKHPDLAHFRYYLKQVFNSAKYNLSEAEEKIIKLKSPQAADRWVEAVEKIISNRSVLWKNRQLPLPEAMDTIDLLGAKDKKSLWALIMKEMEQISEVTEHEFNAIITDTRTQTHPTPVSYTHLTLPSKRIV